MVAHQADKRYQGDFLVERNPFRFSRVLAELHRDSLYPNDGERRLGGLELTVGKPQGRSLCVWGVASGSAASHSDPGSSGMVEFSEESPFRHFSANTTESRSRRPTNPTRQRGLPQVSLRLDEEPSLAR